MSLQVKLPFGRTQGALLSCGTCAFSTRHRVLYDRHVKRCAAATAASSTPPAAAARSPRATNEILPAQPVNRHYKCTKCSFHTGKSRMFLVHQKEVHGENIHIFCCDQCAYAAKHKHKVLRHRNLMHKSAPPIYDVKDSSSADFKMDDMMDDTNGEDLDGTLESDEMSTPEKSGSSASSSPKVLGSLVVKREATEKPEGMDHKDDLNEAAYSQTGNGETSPTHNPDPTENAYDYIVTISNQKNSSMYKCRLCTYSHPFKWKIAQHIRTIHMRKSLFKCPYCDFVSERKIEWCVHKTKHTNKAVYSCSECSYRTTMRRNFDRHLSRHHVSGPVKCSMCSYSSTGEAAIQRHMAEYHPSPEKENLILSVSGSVSTPQPKKPVVKLPVEYSPSTSNRASTPPNTGPVVCGFCGLTFSSECKLRVHLVSHSPVAAWPCPLCSLRYKRAADLNRHMKRKHGCHMKDFTSGDSDVPEQDQPLNLSVKKAIALDLQDQPLDLSLKSSAQSLLLRPENLKCSHCSYLAKWPSDLRRHMLVHSIEKRYRCQYCGRRYKYQFDLNMHLRRTHRVPAGRAKLKSQAAAVPVHHHYKADPGESGPKPSLKRRNSKTTRKYKKAAKVRPPKLKCDFCSYVGKYHAEVKRHMRLHTGEKPYGCPFCGYRTHWKGDMKRHLVKHHPKEVEEHGDLMELVNDTERPAEEHKFQVEPATVRVVKKSTDYTASAQFDTTSHPASSNTTMDTENKSAEQARKDKMTEKCPNCNFVCDAPSKLKCHMEVHQNLKRFMCPECGKRSNWLWDIRKHIKKDHEGCSLDVTELSEDEARATLEKYLLTHKTCNRTPSSKESTPVRVLDAFKTEVDDDASVADSEASAVVSEPSPKIPPKGKYRPFKCSECGRRSNWKWDLKKHILTMHPGATLIMMSEAEAKATFDEVVSRNYDGRKSKSWEPVKPASLQPVDIAKMVAERCRPFKCSVCGKRSNWKWDLNKHIRGKHPSGQVVVLDEVEARASIDTYLKEQQVEHQQLQRHVQSLRHQRKRLEDTPSKDSLSSSVVEDSVDLSSSTHSSPEKDVPLGKYNVDTAKLKRFKCSGCPYRSNFRSDILRHMKRKHRRMPPKVLLMSFTEAAATLSDYRETWARKKFVATPSKTSHPRARSSTKNALPTMVPLRFAHDPEYSYSLNDYTISYVEKMTNKENGVMEEETAMETDLNANEVPEKAPVWRCSKCDYKDKNKETVMSHFRSHGEVTAYECMLCGATSESTGVMQRHVKEKHARTDYSNVLSVTGLTGSDPSAIKRCIVKNYKCKECGMTNSNKGAMFRHVKERHKQNDPKPFIAEFERVCSTVGNQKDAAISKSLACDICPFRASKQGLLNIHQGYHKPQPGNNFKCKYCPYYVCAVRLLHQHTRLHLRDQAIVKSEVPEDNEAVVMETPDVTIATQSSPKQGRARHFCESCPYVSVNRNDYLYHKQFHRPKTTAPYKCDLCPYWVSLRRLLTQHLKVHSPEYMAKHRSSTSAVSPTKSVVSSPAKSDISSMSETFDLIEMAQVKQHIIASKITSAPITPEKLNRDDLTRRKLQWTEAENLVDDSSVMQGIVVNRSGEFLTSGTYRKLHKCRYCPYTYVRSANVRLHEKMHGHRKGKDNLVKCPYCDYYCGNKGLLSHHVKVHSMQYNPGQDVVNDVELSDNNDDDSAGEERESTEKDENKPAPPVRPEAKIDARDLPQDAEYYIKFDESTGEHILDRAIFKKWCCEKCPYATMKKSQFERHVTLHGSKQRYTCDYCDYSVPGYHLVLQHRKLHLVPNPNLLSVQSISNLQRLPEVPADLAAAANFPDEDTTLCTQDNSDMFENSGKFTEPKKMYRCDRCPYTNIRRDHLLAHLKFHMINSELLCPYCDYSVSKVHLLNQHIKVHFNIPGNELNALPAVDGLETFSDDNLPKVECRSEKPVKDTDVSRDQSSKKSPDAAGTEPVDLSSGEQAGATSDGVLGGNDDAEKSNELPNGCVAETDTMWVCEYCDRAFSSSVKLLKHEMQHLVGNKF